MNQLTYTPALKISIEHTLASGQRFPVVLDARRAAYLPDSSTLLVSDLHWGKGETFRLHGIPIPDSVLQSDLARLSELIADYQPTRLLVLGDLIHGVWGLTDELNRKIKEWRGENGLPIILIAGNHDRQVDKVAQGWGIDVVKDSLLEPPFLFSHHPEMDANQPDLYNWCGHIHPVIRLSSAMDRLRLPCFHLQAYGATLPAFSEFTGGYNIQPKTGDRVFALSDGILIPI
jgi:uncharacterized protein